MDPNIISVFKKKEKTKQSIYSIYFTRIHRPQFLAIYLELLLYFGRNFCNYGL